MEAAALVDVRGIAHALGVQIVDAPLKGALAQLVVHGSSVRILLSHRLADSARRRVAIAHELGHYLLRHRSPTTAELGSERGPHRSTSSSHGVGDTEAPDVEGEADRFASELLTPAVTVDALCYGRDPDLGLCTELADIAAIPIEFASMRIAECSDQICAAVHAVAAGIVAVRPSHRFRSMFGGSLATALRQGQPLDPRTLAWRLRDHATPRRAAQVPADAWLRRPGLPLIECSARLAPPAETITMLWAEQWDAGCASPNSLRAGA